MAKLKKILVANRGEIALRIMRSVREMGKKTVAIYSEADRTAPHVRYADEAVCVGPGPAAQSYLNMDAVLRAAQQTRADGIHPGYGFLSENPDFAKRVEQAKLTFIGPSAAAMKVMGNKLAAKAAVRDYDVPLVPGTDKPVTDAKKAAAVAKKIGFPILVKAAAGGGGKGMRVVEKAADLKEQLERAVSEAKSAFGDGAVFIEKYIGSPRHIEIQVLGDKHGNIVHLFERECSVQRRHQKVIEEAPSAVLTGTQRAEMGRAAVDVAKACNYVGAGTVEFIAESDKKGRIRNFYFLEMNTRLQVEHPVTECITGIDLVKEQVRIAEGKTLPFAQDDLKINGHAVEVRVYAEDPTNKFLPDIGRLKRYRPPAGPGVRVDDGVREGMDIPIHYDPMIAKLVTWGKDRPEAIQRMIRAIEEYELAGMRNTLSFGKYVMEHQAFASGRFDTHFVNTHFKPGALQEQDKQEARLAAAMAGRLFQQHRKKTTIPVNQAPSRKGKRDLKQPGSPWTKRAKF